MPPVPNMARLPPLLTVSVALPGPPTSTPPLPVVSSNALAPVTVIVPVAPEANDAAFIPPPARATVPPFSIRSDAMAPA